MKKDFRKKVIEYRNNKEFDKADTIREELIKENIL